MIPCGLCGANALDERSARCSACGYDEGHTLALEKRREQWLNRHNIAGTISIAGMVFVNVGVVMGAIAVAAISSLGFAASLFYAGYCIVRTRMVEQLRAARSPRALPEARLL